MLKPAAAERVPAMPELRITAGVVMMPEHG
jgi:hypothetical protein